MIVSPLDVESHTNETTGYLPALNERLAKLSRATPGAATPSRAEPGSRPDRQGDRHHRNCKDVCEAANSPADSQWAALLPVDCRLKNSTFV